MYTSLTTVLVTYKGNTLFFIIINAAIQCSRNKITKAFTEEGFLVSRKHLLFENNSK